EIGWVGSRRDVTPWANRSPSAQATPAQGWTNTAGGADCPLSSVPRGPPRTPVGTVTVSPRVTALPVAGSLNTAYLPTIVKSETSCAVKLGSPPDWRKGSRAPIDASVPSVVSRPISSRSRWMLGEPAGFTDAFTPE